MQEASGGKKKFWARLAMSALVGFILAVDTGAGMAAVTVIPTVVKFKAKVGTLTYRIVRIKNTGPTSEVIVGATASPPLFWPTWGGTCNSVLLAKVVAAGQSCTFEFGFHPTQKGTVSGQGSLIFLSGAQPTVHLKGTGK